MSRDKCMMLRLVFFVIRAETLGPLSGLEGGYPQLPLTACCKLGIKGTPLFFHDPSSMLCGIIVFFNTLCFSLLIFAMSV